MDDVEPLIFRDLSTADLLTLARHLEELTKHPGWNGLMRAVQAQREGQLNLLAFGRADRPSAEYARLGGVVYGIDFVLGVPEVVAKRAKARERAEMTRLEQDS